MGNGLLAAAPAGVNHAVKGVELRQAAGLKDLLLKLAVVAEGAVQDLQGDVAPAKHVEHAHALDVMEEPPVAPAVEGLVEVALAGVAKRRVAQVVAKGNGLDEV